METKKTVPLLILGIILISSGGCRQPHPGWEPPLEETSTRFLQVQVEEALDSVREAQGNIRSNPERVDRNLTDAVRSLEQMSKYYLPLLEARERAYVAHRFLYYGESNRARAELEGVEEILGSVAESGGPALQPALKRPLDLVSEAKSAVRANTGNAPDLIKSLAVHLNLMALKGNLELPGKWPTEDSAGRP